jgi:DNA primase
MIFLNSLIDHLNRALGHNQKALDYLHSRKVSDEEIKEFKIGYSRIVSVCNDESKDFKIFSDETYRGKVFESKIIFPIYDMLNNPVGLLGRSIDTKEFKLYINSEGKFTGVMFGLFQALPFIYKSGRVFTVEGPFDFLAYRKVYPNTVATLTAELTAQQHEILSMFAKEIITVFDSDKPGKLAAERASQWNNVKTVCLGWKDPDAGLKYLEFEKFKKHVQRKIGELVWL